ncbi:Bax inhibitor-1/YccA family protein [Pseudostreptobacillus hongkongensis]|uniref:Bax inhibitor-1/YccA family protein n=1 Tax=Pseudostreptobacillus hongkongensis TaxID=1162717 RepID=UPI00082A6E65|nr:Bax inhibitor-1/YccA family protein [Pseudostreptobacillus hongkongensis]
MERRYYSEVELEYEISKKIQGSYSWMMLGLLITFGFVFGALFVPEIAVLAYRIYYVLVIAMVIVAFSMTLLINKLSSVALKGLFIAYSVIMGLFLSPLTFIYDNYSIISILIGSAAMFGSMSLYGYLTRDNLQGYAKYLFGALIGMIVLSLFNMYFRSNGVDTFISILGVLVFAIYAAVDTQRIKVSISELYFSGNEEIINKVQIIGALNLYVDFINLFLYLLRIFGKSRD